MDPRWLACLVASSILLAGCLADPAQENALDAAPESPAPPEPADVPPTEPPTPARRNVETTWDDGALSIVAPLDVVLFGFPVATVNALRAELAEPFGPKQLLLHNHPEWDTNDGDLLAGGYTTSDAPLQQQVRVSVHAASDSDLIDYRMAVAGPGRWDGNAAEAWMADYLQERGIAGGPLAPLVLMHSGTEDHHYRIQFPNGVWDPARVVGGAEDVLLMDLSAGSDRYTGTDKAYMEPVSTSDLDALVEAVHDAVRFRLLQGPIYPITVAPCHAVTLLYAVHATAEQGVASGMSADEALDAGLVERALEELTDEEVHVDVVRYDLPQDDPVLWGFVRMISANLVGPVGFEGQELARNWVDENWEDIHVDHEGCEEYVSLLVYSDALENYAYGIAEYDGEDRRFSFSLMPEWYGGMYEPGLVGLWCCKPEYIEGFEMVNMLFTHETGHLFGQMHPHHAIDDTNDGLRWTFSPTRTVMSYAVDELDVGFGELDQRNWERNRVGFAAAALDDAGLRDDAVAAGFLDLVEAGDFAGAVDVAQALLAG